MVCAQQCLRLLLSFCAGTSVRFPKLGACRPPYKVGNTPTVGEYLSLVSSNIL